MLIHGLPHASFFITWAPSVCGNMEHNATGTKVRLRDDSWEVADPKKISSCVICKMYIKF